MSPARHLWRGVLCWLAAAALAVGVVVGFSLPFHSVRTYLDAYAGDGSADAYTQALHRRVCVGAGVVFVCGLLGLAACAVFSRHHSDWLRTERERWRSDLRDLLSAGRRTLQRNWREMLLLIVIASAARVPWVNRDMRFDEAYSYLHSSSFPWFLVVSRYDDPNNHVLYNLMVSGLVSLLGNDPFVLRLPAVIAGVLIAPLSYLLGSSFCGRGCGLFAGLFVALSSALVDYSVNGRGYTLMVLCVVSGWLLAQFWAQTDNRLALAGTGLCGILGLWTIPLMLLPLGHLLLWLLWIRPARRKAIIALATGIGVGTLLVYSPALLVGDLFETLFAAATNSRRAAWSVRAPRGLSDAAALLMRDIPMPIRGIICGLLLLGLFGSARRSFTSVSLARSDDGDQSHRTGLFGVAVTGLIWLGPIVATGRMPFARGWLFLVPFLAILVGSGLMQAVRIFQRKSVQRLVVIVAVLLLIGIPYIEQVRKQSPLHSRETGLLKRPVALLERLRPELNARTRLVAIAPASAPLVYYSRRLGFSDSLFALPDANDDLILVLTEGLSPQDLLNAFGLEALDEAVFFQLDVDSEAIVLQHRHTAAD